MHTQLYSPRAAAHAERRLYCAQGTPKGCQSSPISIGIYISEPALHAWVPTYAFGTLRFLDIGFPTGNTLQETYCRFLLCPKCYSRPRFRPRRAAGVCRASGSSSLRAFALLTASPLRLLASALAIVFIRHLEFHIYAGYSSSGLSCVSGLRQSSTLLSLVAPSASEARWCRGCVWWWCVLCLVHRSPPSMEMQDHICTCCGCNISHPRSAFIHNA